VKVRGGAVFSPVAISGRGLIRQSGRASQRKHLGTERH
jgi:hypothetical protein